MPTTSGVLVIDSWAWLEQALGGPRHEEVGARLRQARRLVTVRDVLVETYGFLLRRTKPEVARDWWHVMRESDVVVLEPSLVQVESVLETVPRGLGLSLTDVAVVWAARHERTADVATADRGFAALGFHPLFA